jgi:hypothetical protein
MRTCSDALVHVPFSSFWLVLHFAACYYTISFYRDTCNNTLLRKNNRRLFETFDDDKYKYLQLFLDAKI